MTVPTEAAVPPRTATQSTLRALRIAVRSLRLHPGLAVVFLSATLLQGALQGAMIWALREVLIKLGSEHGAARGILVAGAITVFAVVSMVFWVLRNLPVGHVLAP